MPVRSPDETRRLLDRLVSAHNFRIGIEVYQAVLAEINPNLGDR